MEYLMYNSTSFLRVTFSQFNKEFGLPGAPVALVSGVNTPRNNHRFKSLLYTKAKNGSPPNLHHLLIYSSSPPAQFHWLVLVLKI